MMAAAEINRGVNSRDIDLIFCAIQNLLNATANISKALWGGGGKREPERKPLRESLGVADDSPLKEVGMRNNYEHMDERIDRWWAESPRHNMIDFMIGSASMIQGADEIELFRQYDPSTGTVAFWGQTYNLREIVAAISELAPIAKAEADKPHWDPPQ